MLDTELAYFAAHQADWKTKYPDHYLLIKGNSLIGAFMTREEAVATGLKEFGAGPFLVRHVDGEPDLNIPAMTVGVPFFANAHV